MRARCLVRLLALAVVIFLTACPASDTAPKRPEGVPEQALWVGGADGGVWVLVVLPAKPRENLYQARVWAEHTGDSLFEGFMQLDPPGGIPPQVGNSASYTGWDGDTLYLSDGRELKTKRSPTD